MILRDEPTSRQTGGQTQSPSGSQTRTHRRTPGDRYETIFNQIVDTVALQLSQVTGVAFTLSVTGEESQFTRFNQAKVRQSGQVCDGQLTLTLMQRDRTASHRLPFTGNFAADWETTQQALTVLQAELPQLPVDPYVVLPAASEHSRQRDVHTGQLLREHKVANALIEPVSSLDFSGLYAGGIAYRAYGDSTGKRHWFETPSFTLDYSLFSQSEAYREREPTLDSTPKPNENKAVKGILAGSQWTAADYSQNIAAAQRQLALLQKPTIAIPKGSYRTYLAPAAVADIVDTIIWGGGLGEAALRQGNSAFGKLEAKEAKLSTKFSLTEDFRRINVPRFNSSGAIAPTQTPIIQNGQWANSLVNARSAKEYNKSSNAANTEESMRAPVVAAGTLREADILTALGTGLYLSNLHYLNWSDLTAGRITGMTRYACFWVENGEIVAPIENLRFDDNLYRFLGEGLIDLTDKQTFIPAVDTYERRSLGGMWMPGMLIDQFRYTL